MKKTVKACVVPDVKGGIAMADASLLQVHLAEQKEDLSTFPGTIVVPCTITYQLPKSK